MNNAELINNTTNKESINTSNLYFELVSLDTYSTKFINIDAIDYTKLEKAYTKSINISIKYFDKLKKCDRGIGNIELICFDLNEAILDRGDIKEILEAEGFNTVDIYNVIINNFNKAYYKYFGYSDESNICNITNLNLIKEFDSEDIIYYILKNITKVIYHLLGLKVSTLLCHKKYAELNINSSTNIYEKLGFLEIDNEEDFIAKNFDITTNNMESNLTKLSFYQQKLSMELKALLNDKNELKSILDGDFEVY